VYGFASPQSAQVIVPSLLGGIHFPFAILLFYINKYNPKVPNNNLLGYIYTNIQNIF
jgi:hypothetical protein